MTGALLGALLAAVLLLMTPAIFESSATLLIIPPQFASTLKPGVFPIPGHRRLVMSDTVMLQRVGYLREKHLLGDGEGSLPGAFRLRSLDGKH